jgi:predicted membrane-bound spermidine synthase
MTIGRSRNTRPTATVASGDVRLPAAPLGTPSYAKSQKFVPVSVGATFLFVSGFCSLIFQVCWFREFRLVFGASTAASSTVLAVFMGGLGLGNWILGRTVDRTGWSPLRLYAALEIGVALTVAMSPVALDLLHAGYFSLGGQQSLGFAGATALRLLISTLVLGVPTFLMGGTLPAAARAVTTGDDRQRHAAAWLYGMNTLGAVCGSFGSTFLLIQHLGTRNTLWLACGINAITALVALLVARRVGGEATPSIEPETRRCEARTGGAQSPEDVTEAVAYVVAALAGFTFFLMELVWYRMLGPVLGGTTYTFGLILTIALTGIGLGAAAYPWIFPRHRAVSIGHLACLCALEACCLLLPFAVGDDIAILAARMRAANSWQFVGEVAGWFAITGIVVFPASFVSGLQFPVLVALLGSGDRNIGKQLGTAFGWNTIGAISGALAGGFGLLPLLSAPGVWRMTGIACLVQALALAGWARRSSAQTPSAMAAVALSVLAVVLANSGGPTAAWRHGGIGAGRGIDANVLQDANSRRAWRNAICRATIWERDGVESSVALNARDGLALIINGKSDGNAVNDVSTQVMLGLVGAALHPAPKQAIVVGLGTGESAGWLAEVPGMDRVDVVELEPAVCEMARRCSVVNFDVMQHAKAGLIVNDAREVFLTSKDAYDLMVCEPSNPYRSGVANLFTQEFYRAGARRLRENGLFVQWLQAYETDERTIRTVLRTFRSVFPEVLIWEGLQNDLIIIGSPRAFPVDVEQLRERLSSHPFREGLQDAWATSGVEGFFSHYIGGGKLVEAAIGRGESALNTDDRNEIEYAFARTVGTASRLGVPHLRQLAAACDDVRPAVRGEGVAWDVVDREREWFAFDRGAVLGEERPVNAVLDRHLAKDTAGMVAAWEALPAAHGCLHEVALVASTYAMSGDSRAESLAARLASERPIEALMIRGILAWRQRRSEEAVDMLTDAIRRLRTKPWAMPVIRERAFDAAIAMAVENPLHATRLLEVLSQPFAALTADESRRDCALHIALQGPAVRADSILATYEPQVPWTRRFLTVREAVYRQSGNPLETRAARELAEFDRDSTRKKPR